MNKNLLIVLAFLLFNIGYGQTLKTWTGAVSTAWDVDENWDGGEKPTAYDDVLITSVTNLPIITNAGASCAHLELKNSTPGTTVVLTVKGSGTFSPASIVMNSNGGDTSDCSLNINTGKVSVSGNITMNGNPLQNDITFSGDGNLLIGGIMTGGILNANSKGTVTYNGVGTRNVGSYTYNNLTISGNGVRTITSGVIVNGILNMAGTATVSAAPTYGVDASLHYSTVSYTVGPEWVSPFTAKGGVLISTPALTIASTVTMGSNVADKKFNDGVALIVEEDASLIFGSTDLYLGGDFINNNGSLTTDGFVYLTGNVSQSISNFVSSKGVAMIKGAGTATFTGKINTKKLIINGSGVLSLGSGLTHTFTDWERTNGTLNARTSVLKFSGNVIGSGGTFIPGTGTVEFNGGAQNLGTGSITYNNLILSGSGTKTFGAVTTINDTFSIVDGVKADLTANLVHTAKSIKIGTSAGAGGSWGSSLSNAVNKNNTFFISNNGIVNVGPTIVISTTNIAALTSTYGTPSGTKNFDISALAMLEGILVTAPEGFEVSTDGIAFSNSLTIGAAGVIASTKVFVRLKGTIDAKDYSGDIVLTSNGTTTINIAIATSTVNKAPLTITANDNSKTYGSENPVLTANYVGFVNGDTVASLTTAVTIATTAVTESTVGNYPITVSGALLSNYTISYGINGVLTINKAELTITANKITKTHGEANPAFTVEYSGFVNGDTAAKLDQQAIINTDATTDSAIGEYPITVSGATSKNYTIKFVDGILEVVASKDAGLSDIVISNGTLDKPFDTDKKGYTVDVPNETNSYVINPIPSNPNATVVIKVDGVTIDPTTPLDLKVGDNVIKIEVTAEDGVTKETYEVIVTRATSNNADLIDLATSKGKLEPGFSKEELNYTATVTNDVTTINVTPVTSDTTAIVTISGEVVPSGTASSEIPLHVGENEIKTIVRAQDGTIKEYTVIVTREEAPKSNNAGLADIIVSEGTLSPAFNTDTNDYKVDVPNGTNSIIVTPITIDPNAKVEIKVDGITVSDNTAPIDLKEGDNVITVVVTAEDGTQEIYTVIVDRADAPASKNSDLTDLAISEGTLSPAFAEGTTAYTATVPNDIVSINVTPTIADATATITVDGKEVPSGTTSQELPLHVGENIITTVVTAQDGTTTTYTVVVIREEAAASDNAGLSDIVISDGALSPAFNTDTHDYRVDVPNETNSIVITPITIDPNATVEIKVDGKIVDPTAPIDLKVGENEITIVVTAADGVTQETYTVIVNRADGEPQAIVPTNIITPNGDGKNDYWIIDGLDKYPNNSVKVFDRAARLVYSKNNYNNDWDGSYKGSPVNEDTYYYLIDLGNGSPKIKGFISIIRN